MRPTDSTRLVAIVGGSGAGKSWLADRLRRRLRPHATRLSLDDFYRDRSHLTPARREHVNYDNPRAIDWASLKRVLADCRAGRPIRAPRYDFTTHQRLAASRWQEPKRIVVVDGLWLLRPPGVRRLFDVRIFLECPVRVRLARRLRRDVAGRGRDPRAVHRQFRRVVTRMHRRFVAPQTRWANLVLKHPVNAARAARLGDWLREWTERRPARPPGTRERLPAEFDRDNS